MIVKYRVPLTKRLTRKLQPSVIIWKDFSINFIIQSENYKLSHFFRESMVSVACTWQARDHLSMELEEYLYMYITL